MDLSLEIQVSSFLFQSSCFQDLIFFYFMHVLHDNAINILFLMKSSFLMIAQEIRQTNKVPTEDAWVRYKVRQNFFIGEGKGIPYQGQSKASLKILSISVEN